MYPVDPVEGLISQWEAQQKELGKRQRIVANISASPYWQSGKPRVRAEHAGGDCGAAWGAAFVAMRW